MKVRLTARAVYDADYVPPFTAAMARSLDEFSEEPTRWQRVLGFVGRLLSRLCAVGVMWIAIAAIDAGVRWHSLIGIGLGGVLMATAIGLWRARA